MFDAYKEIYDMKSYTHSGLVFFPEPLGYFSFLDISMPLSV